MAAREVCAERGPGMAASLRIAVVGALILSAAWVAPLRARADADVLTVSVSPSVVTDRQALTISGRSQACATLHVDLTYFSYRGGTSGPEYSVLTKDDGSGLYRIQVRLPVNARPQQRVQVHVAQICTLDGQNVWTYLTIVRARPLGRVSPAVVHRQRAFVLRAQCFGSRRARWVPLVLVDHAGHRHSFAAQTFERRQIRAIVDVPSATALGPATIRFANSRECPGVLRQPIAQITILPAQR